MWALFQVGPALATPSAPAAQVSVLLDPAARVVEGTVEIQVLNTSEQALDHVILWRFPEHLRERPPRWDALTRTRLFPGGFDPGGMEVWEVVEAREQEPGIGPGGVPPVHGPSVGSGTGVEEQVVVEEEDGATLRVSLLASVLPGETVTLKARFRTRIPHRYGSFGVVADQVTLDGGFFPRPVPLTPAGWRRDQPPGDLCVDLQVALKKPRDGALIVNGDLRTVSGEGPSHSFPVGCVQRVSLVWLPGAQTFRHRAGAVEVTVVHQSRRYQTPPEDTLPDLGALDTHGLAARAAASAAGYLRTRWPDAGSRVLLVETPLRRRIAAWAPGMVLFSDRAFKVTPLSHLQSLHEQDIARAVFNTALAPSLHRRETVELRDRILGLVATDLTLQWRAATRRSERSIRDLLGPADFVRAVDEVIYAPQVPFHSTYFPVVDDADPLRQHFTLFSHDHPSGRLWREKLVDRIGVDVMQRLVFAMLRDGLNFEGGLAATEVSGGLDYLRQWDGARRQVNYRLGLVEPGSDENGPFMEVQVLREGDQQIREPVTVSGHAPGGAVRSVWDGEGPVGVVRLPGVVDRRSVRLDPGYRLMETDLGEAADPRWDNFVHHPWKVLLNGFAFQASTATGRLNTSVFGSAKRAHDLSHRFSASAYDGERSLGVGAGWTRGLGPKLRPNQRRVALGVGLGAAWLKPRGDETGGRSAGVALSLGYSSVVNRVDPRTGTRAGVQVGSSVAVTSGEVSAAVLTSAGASRLLDLGAGHVLAGRLSWASQWGRPQENQKLGVGGRAGIRGAAPYAITGVHRVSTSVEWRHPYSRNLSINFLQLAWFEGIDGVLFVDGVGLSDDPAALGHSGSWSLGLGYGLRFHYLLSGVNPMVLYLDAGVPLALAGSWTLAHTPQVVLLTGLGQSF